MFNKYIPTENDKLVGTIQNWNSCIDGSFNVGIDTELTYILRDTVKKLSNLYFKACEGDVVYDENKCKE